MLDYINMNVKDMALQVEGPFPWTATDEFDRDATHFYRLRFWSVAESGDEFVARIAVSLATNMLYCIVSEDPAQIDFLDTVMAIDSEENRDDYSDAERNYYGKMSDLVYWFEAEVEGCRAKAGMKLWRELGL